MKSRYAARLYNYFLNEETLLVWAKIAGEPPLELQIYVNDERVTAHSDFFIMQDAFFAYAIICHADLVEDCSPILEIRAGSEVLAVSRSCLTTKVNSPDRFYDIFSQLSVTQQDGLYRYLAGTYAQKLGVVASVQFRECMMGLHARMSGARFSVNRSYWLHPNVLYFEGQINSKRPMGEPKILSVSGEHYDRWISRFIQLSEKEYAFIAIFPSGDKKNYIHSQSCFTYFSDHEPVAIDNMHPLQDSGLEFLHYLNRKPAHQKQALREIISRSLIDYAPVALHEAVGSLMTKMQLFVQLPPIHCTNESEPFNINFETLIPIGCEGVFASGWIRDPYQLLESIEVHSALGFSFFMHENFFRTQRPDVQQHFANSTYGKFQENMGFVAYAPLPQLYRRKIEGIATLHALRFTVRLRGGIVYQIQPEQHFRDAFDARDFVTKIVPSTEASEELLHQCLAPAAGVLQQQCMQQVAVKEVYEFGPRIDKPKVSLSIPLYQRLDFLKVQMATLANDADMRDCELIYVLDSPWQEAELREFLREYAHLYQLCVKMVVMKRNSGYAAASNMGTLFARGDYIVLLNSDVFPAKKGWVSDMVALMQKNKQIGALSPKLIYEDESLQHAGMFFAKTTYPDWINLHYYKGYPSGYAAANETRMVPAVTGACLMMKKEVWEDIGRLSVDYIIGDFEDSDLCLRCIDQGLQNWYYADSALYHLERQSVPLNSSYAESLAWRLNARRHTERWGGLIERLMQKFDDKALSSAA